MTEYYFAVLSRRAQERGNGWGVAIVVSDRPRRMLTRTWPRAVLSEGYEKLSRPGTS